MKKYIFSTLLIVIILSLSTTYASIEGTKLELNNSVNKTKSIFTEIKKEGSYYSKSTKEKYESNMGKFKQWYRANNKSIMYLPYLDVKIFDFFSGIFVCVFIIWLSVKFLTKKR